MIFKVNGNKLGLSIFGLTDKISSIKKKVNNAAQAVSDYNNYIANISNPTLSAPFLKNLQNTSGAFKDYTKTLNGARASLDGFADYLVVTNAKTKLLSFGIQALNFTIKAVGMTLLSIGISKFVESLQEAKANQEALTNELIESGEEAENTNNKISDLISTYQQLVKSGGSADELKNLQEQIAELVGVQADNLDLVNGKLDEELKKLQEISSVEAQSNKDELVGRRNTTATALLDAWNEWSFDEDMPSDYFAEDLTSEMVDYITSQIPELKSSNSGLLVGSEGIEVNYDVMPKFESEADEIVWIYNKVLEAKTLLDKSYEQDDLSANDFYKNIISWLGKYKDEVEAYTNALNAFNQNEAIIAVGENLKTFTGEINDQTSFDNWVEGIINAEGATGDYADAIREVCESKYPQFKKQTDGAGTSATNTSSKIATLSESYKSLKEEIDVVVSAYDQMTQNGHISADTLFDLLNKHHELIDYLEMENGQYKISTNTLKKLINQKIQDRIETYKTAKSNIASTREEIQANITKTKSILANIKATKEEIKTSILHGDSKYDLVDLVRLEKNSIILTNLEKDLAKFDEYAKNIDILENLSADSFLSGNAKSPAEKYFDEQKYLLETNQITQEEYLKRINEKYKEFYEKQMLDLEDYAQYSQEVYDGFKDMYKEDLEAQKEAWEEKKDVVSEYYDNLREQIENAHDEEDYEKEQSEKRKAIFDLDMQIAELMRDGSEKAKARIAELEEERLKAEEELLDFETDKAREDELSRLEKEQEAEEKKIQAEIDAIDEELQKIDGDIVDGLYNVRKTIVDYAAKKGITLDFLDFAYASGTRSSVGGFGRINEKGIEMISAPDGNGNYVNLMPNSYVFSAKATEFLWKLATEHSLPQAMYNSIAKSIKTQSSTPSVNIAQPITITMGDVIIKGNADKQTVADIKKQQENTVRMVLQKIKELQK